MKPKLIDKKLLLNKKTIADLNENALKEIYGGVTAIETCTSIQETCLTICETKCASNCFSCEYTFCKTC